MKPEQAIQSLEWWIQVIDEESFFDYDALNEEAIRALLSAYKAQRSILNDFARTYAGFEDGDGNPCPIVARAQALQKEAAYD